VRGGAGFVGTVHKVTPHDVHIRVSSTVYGDRIVKAKHHLVSLFEMSMCESYKVGDRVIPKIGPHKGEVHKVIHVHDTGHINITPERHGVGRKNRYHLGAARAHPEQVERAEKLDEMVSEDKKITMKPFYYQIGHDEKTGKRKIFASPTPFKVKHHKAINEFSNTPKTPGSLEIWHKAKVKQEKLTRTERRRAITNPKVGLESKKYRNLAENPIVREAFEAAVAKKNENELKPEQLDPQGAEPQQPEKPEKQSNVPKPEKKTDKLKVKGPGPDDTFQKEPEVTGLTALVKA
jgi:hypothetical protein